MLHIVDVRLDVPPYGKDRHNTTTAAYNASVHSGTGSIGREGIGRRCQCDQRDWSSARPTTTSRYEVSGVEH